jgi:hypothetical protein
MKLYRLAAGGALLLALFAAVAPRPAAAASVDLAPVVAPLVELAGAVISLIAVPAFWKLWSWLASKAHLEGLKIDDQMRAVINQELMKAIGAGLAKVDGAIAGKPMPVDVKNRVINAAMKRAMQAVPDALDHFGLNDPKPLAAMIEARLGLMSAGAAPVLGTAAAAGGGSRPA